MSQVFNFLDGKGSGHLKFWLHEGVGHHGKCECRGDWGSNATHKIA